MHQTVEWEQSVSAHLTAVMANIRVVWKPQKKGMGCGKRKQFGHVYVLLNNVEYWKLQPSIKNIQEQGNKETCGIVITVAYMICAMSQSKSI